MKRLMFILLLVLVVPSAQAGEVNVAVAANFLAAHNEIAKAFTAATGHKVVTSSGSAGKFVAQIEQGAPFEVFLSADNERPLRLVSENLAVSSSRFTYAIGKLVLWSAKDGLVDGQGVVLKSGNFKHLAIANPKNAPYGAAAMQVIGRLGLAPAVAAKLVTGESIAQAFQFVESGNAELGFVALAQLKGVGGSRWMVPEQLHDPLDQSAVLLKTGVGNPVAVAFLNYLRGPEARAIIARYGYALPGKLP